MSRPKSHEGCGLWFCTEEKHYARNRCARHYQNWLRTGSDIAERPEDLKVVLDVIESMRRTMESMMVHCFEKEGNETCCIFCGKKSTNADSIPMDAPALHEPDCPVLSAALLIFNTESVPMDS